MAGVKNAPASLALGLTALRAGGAVKARRWLVFYFAI